MQPIFENTHICYANLRGKINQQIFETEIRKKKMLDTAVASRNDTGVQVLAYCVLDNEFHLILKAGKTCQMERFLKHVKQNFEESNIRNGQEGRTVFRKTLLRKIEKENAVLRCCVRIHMFPVIQGIVSVPEDYWWCSYQDYLGRNWLPLTSIFPLMEQMDAEPKKAVHRMKTLHRCAMDKSSVINTEETFRV